MTTSAPRLSPKLVAAIDRLAARKEPIAEIARSVGAEADRLGLTRPSYQQVRVLVHRARELRRGPTTAQVAIDVAFRVRPPEALVDYLAER